MKLLLQYLDNKKHHIVELEMTPQILKKIQALLRSHIVHSIMTKLYVHKPISSVKEMTIISKLMNIITYNVEALVIYGQIGGTTRTKNKSN